jgi:hypothetical protein
MKNIINKNYFFGNISVEFLKQVKISSKQPYFQPNFPNKTIHQKNSFGERMVTLAVDYLRGCYHINSSSP